MYSDSYSIFHPFMALFMIVINMLFILNLHRQKDFHTQAPWIYRLFISSTVCAAADALCMLSIAHVHQYLLYLLNGLYFCAFTFTMYSLLEYTIHLLDFPYLRNWRSSIVLLIPGIAIGIWGFVSYRMAPDPTLPESTFTHGRMYLPCFITAVFYALIAIALTLQCCHRRHDDFETKLLPVFFICPILVTALVQLFLPEIPLMNMGLTVVFTLVFLTNQELLVNRGRKRLETQVEQLTEYGEIFQSISKLYFAMYSIDVKNDRYRRIYGRSNAPLNVPETGSARAYFAEVCNKLVSNANRGNMQVFFDLDTVRSRMRDKDMLEAEMEGTDGRWLFVNFIAKARDEKGKVTEILYCVRFTTKEKQEEIRRNHFTEALSREYPDIMLLDRETMCVRTLKYNNRMLSDLESAETRDYVQGWNRYCEHYVTLEDRERLRAFVLSDKLLPQLDAKGKLSISYHALNNRKPHTMEVSFIDVHDAHNSVLFGFREIDALVDNK